MTGRFILLCATVVAAVVLVGCNKDTPESRREACQVTGDKFMELVSKSDYEGAYKETFSAKYRSELSVESFAKYHQGIQVNTGTFQGYQVVKYQAKLELPYVKLTYAIQTANYPTPVYEYLTFIKENDTWRISALDVQLPSVQDKSGQQQTPPGKSTLPGKAGKGAR